MDILGATRLRNDPSQSTKPPITMNIHILGQENPSPSTLDGPDITGIESLLEKFLRHYNKTPSLKYKPILLTFNESEEQMIVGDSFFYRGLEESDSGYALRMLDHATDRVNKSKNLVGGFSVVYIIETVDGKISSSGRKMGITYYQFPFTTTDTDEFGLPVPSTGSGFTVLGRIVPVKI